MVSPDPPRIADLLSCLAASRVPVRIWVKNSKGSYIYVNERIVSDFGIPREKWIGSCDEELFPEFAGAYRRNDAMVLSGGETLQTTDPIERHGRKEFAFVVRFPLDIDSVRHLGAFGVDFTGEVSALMQLQQMQAERYQNERFRALGQLASEVAHDLSNSLNSARLRLDVLRAKADVSLSEDIDAAVRSIIAAAERLRTVRNFIRDGADGESRSEPHRFELKSLISDGIEMVNIAMRSPTFSAGPIQIECSLPESLPKICGLPAELTHVFANLLLNACDAMPAGGTITVTAKADESVTISISDQGVGISPENLEKVFEPFFTTKGTASGLGLSMAKDVMTRIGGEIEVRNRIPAGVEFVLRFPILKDS
jgi:signal transduction histidine kinase